MIHQLEQVAREHGDRLQVIAIERLAQLQEEMNVFARSQPINDFQRFIVDQLLSYDSQHVEFPVRSVVLVAMPCPPYAKVRFHQGQKPYDCYALVASDLNKTQRYLEVFIQRHSLRIAPAPQLPYKRMAVHCGMAEYGRNNITYIPGLGSFFSYAAWFCSLACPQDTWGDIRNMAHCMNCRACVDSCPTGAIKQDRFLIDNMRCLSAMNETGADFPDWLPGNAHHTPYDCLRCQVSCPMNKLFLQGYIGPIVFDAQETARILAGAPYHDAPASLNEKIRLLALDKWAEGIPRNLRLLFSQIDEGYVPSIR